MREDNYSEFYTRKRPGKLMPLVLFWHKRMLTIARKYIPELETKMILEIGPGCGFFAKICTLQKMKYCAVEMNAHQTDFLQKEGFDVVSATIPPIPAGKPVQLIWLSHVLEHAASYTEAKAMLSACYDRVDKDGYVVIIGPDIHHWKTEFWDCDWSHGYPTSLIRVEQLLSETGFSVYRSMHHTSSMTNSFFAWAISVLFRLVPMQLLDYFFYKKLKWRPCHSFMHQFGLRQIYVIGKKIKNDVRNF